MSTTLPFDEGQEIPAGSIALVVNGGLMRGMRSQHRMEAAQARLVRVVTTAPGTRQVFDQFVIEPVTTR